MVPKGTKRVSPAKNLNAKEGCTLMAMTDMVSSHLLTPHNIFTGVFGDELMKDWSDFDESLFLLTENY